ncbi:MAG: veratrol--corrinoid protein metyltransferase [Coriobacteriia bacterium]|nr:veratrol--corrinoid protein metyltransferase [Coriobacteriia bacterium]
MSTTRKLNAEAEQFMKVLKGEVPDFVPKWTNMGVVNPYSDKPANPVGLGSSALPGRTVLADGKFMDMWGVTYVGVDSISGNALPEPNNFILDDITKWRDVIKAPDISNIDWEIACKKDLEARGDISESVIQLGNPNGFFMTLMNFMGFDQGLMAMYEEPEEVKALFDYLADFYCSISDQLMKYWGDIVDFVGVGDDTATEDNPFISPEMHHELIRPYHARVTKAAMDRGMPVMMHCCGRCEDFIEDWISYGVTAWNPAQLKNDLDGIKAKYGNSLVLTGCWDSTGPAGWPDATEELIKETVRATMNRFGKGGGHMFFGSFYGFEGDPQLENRRRWMSEAYEAYREEPYK